jgi:hypothetical protein
VVGDRGDVVGLVAPADLGAFHQFRREWTALRPKAAT